MLKASVSSGCLFERIGLPRLNASKRSNPIFSQMMYAQAVIHGARFVTTVCALIACRANNPAVSQSYNGHSTARLTSIS
jgi:hypothetical protein